MSFDIIQFIQDNEHSFNEVFNLVPVPLFIKDIDGTYSACNIAYEKISGKSCKEMMGKTVYDLWPGEQADIFFAKDKELFDNPGKQIYEADISDSFGKHCIVQFHKVTIHDDAGELIGLIGAIFDITEKKELEERLTRLSEIDALTGMLNRRTGLEQMNQVLNQSQRNKHHFVIAMMDLDNFKELNDSQGHQAGDKTLKAVRDITDRTLRDYDIICRYGGDEFILCLPETNLGEAHNILERLRKEFESENISAAQSSDTIITVSIGVASYPELGKTISQLINASDTALYDAKKAGRNCIKIASRSVFI